MGMLFQYGNSFQNIGLCQKMDTFRSGLHICTAKCVDFVSLSYSSLYRTFPYCSRWFANLPPEANHTVAFKLNTW